MSIQTGDGPIRIDPDDAQLTYRGKTIALNVRSLMWPVILGCVKQSDGSWQVGADLTGDLFASDVAGQPDAVAYWVQHHGGGMGFVRAVVLPRLNAWLAELFPKSDAPVLPLEQINSALSAVRFLPQTDGTLIASA